MHDNYFHAVFEASKGLAQRIRDQSQVDGDGANLVDRVFSVDRPVLAFNTLQTDTERSEHKGFAALLKGCFAAVRNPLAHEPKIMWHGEDDAADYFTLHFTPPPQAGRLCTNHEAERSVTGSLQPYPTYRPSGVPWLGDVPAHWQVDRLKGHVSNAVDQTPERGSGELYIALEHVEGWTALLRGPGEDVSFDSQVKRFSASDVLFGKLRPYLAKVTRPRADGVCVGEFLVLRSRGCDLTPFYLERLLRSKPIIDAADASTFGAKMPSFPTGNSLVMWPTLVRMLTNSVRIFHNALEQIGLPLPGRVQECVVDCP